METLNPYPNPTPNSNLLLVMLTLILTLTPLIEAIKQMPKSLTSFKAFWEEVEMLRQAKVEPLKKQNTT